MRGLTDKMGVSYEGVEKDIRGSLNLIKKRWLAALVREVKKGKSQRRFRGSSREEEEGSEKAEGGDGGVPLSL